MISANLIREARLRAGMSQRELARRLGKPQSSVARWEAGDRHPSLESLEDVIRGCGLELSFRLHAEDTSNDQFIWELLDVDVEARFERHVQAARGMRELTDAVAAPKVRRSGRRKPFEPLGVFRALEAGGLRYVLVGRLAEGLRGSPNIPLDREVAVCPARDATDGAALAAAIRALRGRPWANSADQPLEVPLERRGLREARRWWIPSAGAALAVVDAPPGTRGYNDLHRHSTLERLAPGVSVQTASLVDLVRIADSSPRGEDSLTLPQLRRALELASNYRPPEERPVNIPEGLEELFATRGIAS